MRRWRWLAVYVVLALLARELIPAQLPVAPSVDVLASDEWVLSAGMSRLDAVTPPTWQAAKPLPGVATRRVYIEAAAEFVGVHACISSRSRQEGMLLGLASVRAGQLDFNRQYSLYAMHEAQAGDCVTDALPRRSGDTGALLQLQLSGAGDRIALESLTLTPLVESTAWHIIRLIALPLGILLLGRCFAAYLPLAYRDWRCAAGLLFAASIVFGCCVSVTLKADIFVLLTGGRQLSAASEEQLLNSVFPNGGFALFSLGHFVIFAAAGLFMGFCSQRAWVDLILLALVTETLQIFVPGRGPGLSDVLIDWSGLALAALLLFCIRRAYSVGLFSQQ